MLEVTNFELGRIIPARQDADRRSLMRSERRRTHVRSSGNPSGFGNPVHHTNRRDSTHPSARIISGTISIGTTPVT